MKWKEIVVKTNRASQEAISEFLMDLGCAGVAVYDPYDLKQEILGRFSDVCCDNELLGDIDNDIELKAYFDESWTQESLLSSVKAKLAEISEYLPIGNGKVEVKVVEDEDWALSWKKYYKPFEIAENIVIKPSWEEYKPKQEQIVIEMDPGMAFGTGTHETTFMCSNLIKKYLKKNDIIIDVGCGTGILSIIASKLGAKELYALDIDEVAVTITKENFFRNGIFDSFNVIKGNLSELKPIKADIIVANILSQVIIDLSDLVEDYIKQDGLLIASGIIKEKRDDVVNAYIKKGFELVEEIQKGEWVAMVLKCQNSL